MSEHDQEPGTYWQGFTEGVKYTRELVADGMRYLKELDETDPPAPAPKRRVVLPSMVVTDVSGLIAGTFGIAIGAFDHGPRLVLFFFGWVFGLWVGHRAWWWRHP